MGATSCRLENGCLPHRCVVFGLERVPTSCRLTPQLLAAVFPDRDERRRVGRLSALGGAAGHGINCTGKEESARPFIERESDRVRHDALRQMRPAQRRGRRPGRRCAGRYPHASSRHQRQPKGPVSWPALALRRTLAGLPKTAEKPRQYWFFGMPSWPNATPKRATLSAKRQSASHIQPAHAARFFPVH